MELVSLFEGVVLVSSLVGIYVKMQNELTKVKNRIYTLEQSRSEVTEVLKKLAEDITEIKLLLARKQIDS